MTYNWKCCSLYPNNFGASALKVKNAANDIPNENQNIFLLVSCIVV